MAGRLPKPSDQRARRNKPAVADKHVHVDPVKSVEGIPSLPTDQDWHPRTVRWWLRVWSSPISATWIDLNVLVLERMAGMMDQVHCGTEKDKTHTEIRMLEDRLGFSPLAMRRLGIEPESDFDDADVPLASPRAAKKAADLRSERFLKAVDG